MEEDSGNGSLIGEKPADLKGDLEIARKSLDEIKFKDPGAIQAAQRARSVWINHNLPEATRESAKRMYQGNPYVQARNKVQGLERAIRNNGDAGRS